jgi:hypothetical protein
MQHYLHLFHLSLVIGSRGPVPIRALRKELQDDPSLGLSVLLEIPLDRSPNSEIVPAGVRDDRRAHSSWADCEVAARLETPRAPVGPVVPRVARLAGGLREGLELLGHADLLALQLVFARAPSY